MVKLQPDLAVNLPLEVSVVKLQVASVLLKQLVDSVLKQLVDSVLKHLVDLVPRQHKASDKLQVWVLV